MRSDRRRAPLANLIEIRDHRAPRVLNFLFWANAVVIGVIIPLEFAMADRGTVMAEAGLLPISGVGGFLGSVLLWPFLWWAGDPPRLRMLVCLLFYAVTPAATLIGGYFGMFALALAIANCVAVFGIWGGVAYCAFTALLVLGVELLNSESVLALSLLNSVLWLYLGLGLALISAVLFEAGRRSQETRRLLSDLEYAHEELRRHADRVRELTVAEERARMSREMHDSTGHYLTALTMALSNALRFRTARPEEAWAEVEQARELAREALTDTRRWVRALRPLQMEGRAGVAAMRAMAESFAGGGIAVAFTDDGEWPDMDSESELVCYRALQEGLTNSLRHSGGERVDVRVESDRDGVAVTVTDDGRGADEATMRTGFGLRGLTERVAAVGGSVTTGPANGTEPAPGFRLRVEVPTRERGAALDTTGGTV